MSKIEHIEEKLFNIQGGEQKLKAGYCEIVCSLEPKKKELLQAQITAKLYHLLDQEPTHALLVCQRCEGCPVLRKILRGPCWGALLRVCCQHLEAQQDRQPWPPSYFPSAVRVLYNLLKERPSLDSHQDTQQENQQWTQHHQKKSPEQCQQEHHKDYQHLPPALRGILESARVGLTLALLDGGPLASGSHALVSSTALYLLLQYSEQKGATVAFLNTLWAANHLAGKTKAVNYVHVRSQEGINDQDANSNRGNTQNSKRSEKKNTPINIIEGHTKTTRKSTSVTKSLTIEDVRTAIDSARNGDEGRKLIRRNFEGMEGSYSSSTLLLQGMLNAGTKWLLQESEDEEEERHRSTIFLYSLHPLLLKLCGGVAAQHTLQAFLTLHLWIRAVRELGNRERKSPETTKCKKPEDDCSGKVDEGIQDAFTTTTTRTRLPHPSKDALFSMALGYQGPVFTLLNASWENPAKGVSEVVVRCVEELLSLHEDGTEGAKQQLARDMLQGLLIASTPSSSSSDMSVWTSKSIFPPLALALSHVGCEEALHLYPSLPVHLVSSLGVNHLAPATTAVYKVFLAQLGEASWSQHFLTPISEELCSQNRLIQPHLLSLWLPPTLKKYPSIHWALLASCSSTTPGWLARMALLRTARLVGTLELGNEGMNTRVKEKPLSTSHDEKVADKVTMIARDENSDADTEHVSSKTKAPSSANDENKNPERTSTKIVSNTKEDDSENEMEKAFILSYIQAALKHRDENIRLEALSLLCHTQKTSQPVSHFETVCLQSFLRWNMNIDSAPFRQRVLKCVAALLGRLRGATAFYCKAQNDKGGRPPVEETTSESCSTHNRNLKTAVPELSAATVLRTSAELVLCLIREAHRGMAPDANYQRRILALQLYKEVLMALLPTSMALPHHRKRGTTNPDSLLMYLNTMPPNQSGVWDDGVVMGELSLQDYYSNKSITDLPFNYYTVKPLHQSTYEDKTSPDQSPNSLINTNRHVNESAPTRLSQGLISNNTTSKFNLPLRKLVSNTPITERNPQHHSINHTLDIYGDKKALDQPLVDLAFPWTLNTLLYLCMDEMNDVREEAREIIHIFTIQGKMSLSLSEGKEWMSRALKLCDSPKTSDAESGGTLVLTVALLIPKEHLNEVLEEMSSMKSKDDSGGKQELQGTKTFISPSLTEYLLARVECQFTAAKTNLLNAAKHSPVHGTLQALGHYISEKKERQEVTKKAKERKIEQGKRGRKEEAEKRTAISSLSPSFLSCLTSLLKNLVEFVLDTLASTSALGPAVPPSFAEMGEAVRKVVEEGKEGVKGEEEKDRNDSPSSVASLLEQEKKEEEEEQGLLSSDDVLVLSCCWQILKGCCEVTSRIIHLFAGDPQAADDLIRGVVVRVLLGTRHKGAMEAARVTYGSLWACLLQRATLEGPFGTPGPRFVDILHQQVGEVVEMLESPRGISVTRRAAGVAMMVQAACGAAPRLTPTLLSTTVTSLTSVACSQVGVDESGTTDAPQALALHVLQSLALQSPLSPFLRPHLTSLTSSCLHAFASPSWAIRNAALQLFGSLVTSLVGQKKVRDDTSAFNSLTTPEFLIRHPSLVDLLLAALDGDSECHIGQRGFHDSASGGFVSEKLGYNENSGVAPDTLTLTQDTQVTPGYTKIHSPALSTSTLSQNTHTDILKLRKTHLPHHRYTYPKTEPYNTPPPYRDIDTDTHLLTHTQTYLSQNTHTSSFTTIQTQTPKDFDTSIPSAHNTGTQKQTHIPTLKQTHIKSASILVPVLSLVARLSPGTGLQQNPDLMRTLHRLWHSTASFLESPVCSVRRLAALALVSLTPNNEALPQSLQILLKVSNPMTPTNLLHGHLLALSSFLQTHPILAEDSKLKKSASVSLLWLFSPRNKCHINTAMALNIMMALNINIVDACQIPALDSCLPGAAECRCILTLMKLSQWPRNTIENLFLSEVPVGREILESCFDAFLSEIKDCQCASWLLKCEGFFWHRLEQNSLTTKAVTALLQFLTAIMEKVESAGSCVSKHGLATLLSCMEGSQGSSATCAALVLMAHLMKHPASITEDNLVAFALSIIQHSHPTSSEDLRLGASAALTVAFKPILICHPSVSLPVKEQLIMSTVALLQDENSSIRDTATGIVESLVTMSAVPHEHPYLQPTPHPNLALFEFFRWLAHRSLEANDCTILKILWKLCFDQTGSESSLSATTVNHLRLFQSYSANLYYEPRQVNVMVGVALMTAIKGNNKQSFMWEAQQQNPSYFKLQPKENSNNEQKNCTIGNKGSSNASLTSPRDWLEKERTKINNRGQSLSNLASKHNLWQHRLLSFEAGAYVVSCKIFELLCLVFGVSPELAHHLVWSEKGYCTMDGMG